CPFFPRQALQLSLRRHPCPARSLLYRKPHWHHSLRDSQRLDRVAGCGPDKPRRTERANSLGMEPLWSEPGGRNFPRPLHHPSRPQCHAKAAGARRGRTEKDTAGGVLEKITWSRLQTRNSSPILGFCLALC